MYWGLSSPNEICNALQAVWTQCNTHQTQNTDTIKDQLAHTLSVCVWESEHLRWYETIMLSTNLEMLNSCQAFSSTVIRGLLQSWCKQTNPGSNSFPYSMNYVILMVGNFFAYINYISPSHDHVMIICVSLLWSYQWIHKPHTNNHL